MNKVIDIADFWQFQITFEKYGLLYFERIQDSDLFFWNNEINENDKQFFSKLFFKTFIKEKNTISLSEINFENISTQEEDLFYEKYFEKQFSNYSLKQDKSIINNFKIACTEYEKKLNAEQEKIKKSIKEQNSYYKGLFEPISSSLKQVEKSLEPLKNLEKTLKPLKEEQAKISRMLSSSGFNSMQIALESIQRKNELVSSLMLPKSVNPFIGIQEVTRFPSINNYLSGFSLKSLDSLSANLESFNSLRNSIPKSLFDYEVGFSRNYSDIYKQLNPKWNFLYSETDNSEPYLATKEGQFVPSSNAKDIVGAKELFSDITDTEIANFLGVLEKYPFFASQYSTGKKIYEGLKEYVKTKTISIGEQIFYRARKWDNGQLIPFTENTMWAAPHGKSGQGRFNVSGIPYLYLAETSEIAKKETSIRSAKKKAYTVMKVTNATELFLFDMTSLNSYIFQFCSFKNPDKNYTQYLLPNYIAQCFDYMHKYENIKIDGIKYTSVQNKIGEKYASYVLFNKTQYDFKNIEIVE